MTAGGGPMGRSWGQEKGVWGETSYGILSSLLTAECSTIELPGNSATFLVFILIQRSWRVRSGDAGLSS